MLQTEPQEEKGFVKLKISEFEQEVSWLKQFQFMTVKHSVNYQIGFTNQAEILSYQDPRLPLSCFDNQGRDCLDLVSNRDWQTPRGFFMGKPGDYLSLDFGKVEAPYLKFILVDPTRLAQFNGEPPPAMKSTHLYLELLAGSQLRLKSIHFTEQCILNLGI